MSDDKKEVKAGNSQHIKIKVMGQDNDVMQFCIKKNTRLKKMMTFYCDRVGIDMAAVRFRFDGKILTTEDSPLSLEMEEGDTIEVYQQQTGGTS